MNGRLFLALVLPLAVFGGLAWGLGLLGTYGARFGTVAMIGLLFAAPLWLSVFAWRARRSVQEGDGRVGRYIWHGMAANLFGLGFWFVIGYIATVTGLAEPMEGAAPASPLIVAAFAGAASFIYGLFFFPVFSALFALTARQLGLIPKA